MSRKVSFRRDELPPLTAEKETRLAALVARPDDEVDTSDIPEPTEEQMAHGVRGRFYCPVKQQVTARPDADVLAWLKSQGRGYQSRMNAILRDAMLEAMRRNRG